MTPQPVGRHRDDSPEAQARCEDMERSPLWIAFQDKLHIPRHAADAQEKAA